MNHSDYVEFLLAWWYQMENGRDIEQAAEQGWIKATDGDGRPCYGQRWVLTSESANKLCLMQEAWARECA